jgi:CelD/BcsL family acetyltransferase involved in cellulose biosynthesis
MDPVRIRVLESASDFATLGDEWERLQADAVIGSVFESFDWQHLWWQSYGGDQPLKILVARAGDALVGVLALYVQTQTMLRFPVRLLRFVGTGGDTFPDDLGPVLARGREEEVARALAAAVVQLPGWDVLLLTDLDPACPFARVMESAARAASLGVLAGRAERIAYVDLPATWDAWLKSLSGDRRYRVRNIRKKLNAAHPTRFFAWTDPATLNEGVDRLVHLHHKRWQNVGQTHAFASPQYIEFHRAVMSACLARDRLRLYCLELSGQIVAMYYFYRFRDRIYLMQSGFDPDHSNVKPGQVLLGYIVESAIGEGHKVLDFLKGDHRYKDELATGERETLFLTAFRPSAGAWVYRTRRLYLPALKARLLELKRRLRPAAAAASSSSPAPATAPVPAAAPADAKPE